MPAKMHAEEVDIDDVIVGGLIAAQFPEWSGLALERVESTGTVNALFRLGDDLCVRLPRVAAWAGGLDKELRWLPTLAPHLPLAVPEPVAGGLPDRSFPFRWAVYRWLPGSPWADELVDDERVAAVELAAFVTALRVVEAAGAPRSNRAGPLRDRDAVTRHAIAEVEGVLDTSAVGAAWDASFAAPDHSAAPVWTHGDLLPPNLLVDGGRLRAVIDFGGIGAGDPACDLIAAWSVFGPAGRAAFRDALSVDDGTWARGRGWALTISLLIIPYYPETNPGFVAMAMRTVDAALADWRGEG